MSLVVCSNLPRPVPIPRLAPEQLDMGPFEDSVCLSGRFQSLRVPTGPFALAPVVGRMPTDQLPSAFVFIADPALPHRPSKLDFLPCPKVLVIAGRPATGPQMASFLDYVAAEKFDRVVVASGRQRFALLQAAGVKNLFWFPGLLFAHGDEEVRAARRLPRLERIAMADLGPSDASRRRALAQHLEAESLPLAAAPLGPRGILGFYGSSLIAFDARGGGDLTTRTFTALASGAMLLSERTAAEPAHGLWREGQEWVTYGSAAELIERARYFVGDPAEARRIGERGSRWFMDHFGEKKRHAAFEELVFNGRQVPEFKAVSPAAHPALGGSTRAAVALISAWSEVRALHQASEAVRIVCDASLPAEVERLLCAMPRVILRRRAPGESTSDPLGADLQIVSRARDFSGDAAAARRIWIWDAEEGDFAAVEKAFAGAGFRAPAHSVCFFSREAPAVKAISPDDAHRPAADVLAQKAAQTLAHGWAAVGEKNTVAAIACAREVLTLAPGLAEAYHLAGCAGLLQVRILGEWRMHGRSLQTLRQACALEPDRSDLWREYAVAARIAGGTLPQAVAAFRETVRLDPQSTRDWYGLGEALLQVDNPDGAAEAFAEALKCAPHSLGLMRWRGNALKKLGRLDEAFELHARSLGRREKSGSQPARRAGKRRVVFVVQNGHSWPCMATVHAAFASDPAWEVVVVGLPWLHPSFANSSTKDQDKVFAFLEQKKIAHVRWENFSLTENTADLVFLQNPYDNTRPDGWKVEDLIRAGHRLCYVPYAVEFGGDRDDLMYQFNLPLQQLAYAVFARSNAHRRLFAEHCAAGDRHVIVSGHPKFEDIAVAGAVEPDPEMLAFAAGRPLVLWSPHFDVKLNGTRFCDGYSTFLRWSEFILGEFEGRPEVAFVVRPHPTFFSAMEERGILSRAELDAFVARCHGPNLRLHREPEYFPLLAAADVLISDASSLLFEFGVTGKPVCYLHNPCGPVAQAAYELDMDYVRERFTWATSEVQIQAFLDEVPDAVRDDAGREGRAADLRRRMGVCPEGIGAVIKRTLEARLAPKAKAARLLAV